MGTRHLIAVFKGGEYKVAQYGQFDGYPAGQGVGVLDFLTDDMKRPKFDEAVSNARFISCEKEERIAHKDNEAILDRTTSAGILSIIQNHDGPILLSNNIEFVEDSLFCEWAYVIDLDKNTFEVYRGFNIEPLDSGERFYNGKNAGEVTIRGRTYWPVKHLQTYSLEELPSHRDLEDLERKCYEEYEND